MANGNGDDANNRYLVALTLGALGVVYGDIGTSPLYALRECFSGPSAIPLTPENILGVLSLIFWSLILVISVKYASCVLRADNRGEGGNLALMSLASPRAHLVKTPQSRFITFVGLLAAAFFFGDGMITPAVSVLSAVEGLEIVAPLFTHIVVPLTLVILFLLFLFQRHGTGRIGKIFGPVILVWFLTIGILGLIEIMSSHEIVAAIVPTHAIRFLIHEGRHAFIVLGSVFLVVTGGEALYADMGHFGRRPIKIGWFFVALPGLVLNYFGQGALLLRNPKAIDSPFYLLAPDWARIPLVILATSATVIASQALISGTFSIARQAVHLGYLPRIRILHTSSDEIGQTYSPLVNWLLLASTLLLVVSFQSSSRLVAAYGLAVSAQSLITTILVFFVMREVWGWKPVYAWSCMLFFLSFDLSFFLANCLKIPHGGWVPILIAVVLLLLFCTWRRGREIMGARLRTGLLPVESFVHSLAENPPARVSGTAVFLSSSVDRVPPILGHHLELNKSLHERVALLQIVTDEVPYVAVYDRVQVEGVGHGFMRIIAHYGFMESPNVQEIMKLCAESGFELDTKDVTYYVGKETIIATDRPGMALWREKLFAFMARNAENPTSFFRIPRDRVIELGMQVEI